MSTSVYVGSAGSSHKLVNGDCRIVSLVPSLTELLFDLGLGGYMVGRTGFCIHPRVAVKQVPKVGGTKDINLDVLRRMEATHLVVNIDENRRETVEKTAKFIPNVIVTHPRKPEDNYELYKLLGGIFRKEDGAAKLAKGLGLELRRLKVLRKELPVYRVLYLIWREPWMTVSHDTYISSMLKLIN